MNRFIVRLGAHGKSRNSLQNIYIRDIAIHEKYVADIQGPINDIAVITLARPVEFNGKFPCVNYNSYSFVSSIPPLLNAIV